jgi:RHS repeat-associated protein
MLDVTSSTILSAPLQRHDPRKTAWKRFQRNRHEVNRLLHDLIDAHHTTINETDDLCTTLLNVRNPDGSSPSREQVRDNVMSLILAGHETTASQLAWVFQLLAHNPRVLTRLTAEIDRGDSEEYLIATIQETLRHRPVFLFTIPRAVGASQRPTELPSGVIAMGARTYIPQLGRFLQTDPQPGGSANAYTYTDGDPINSSDPTGEWTQTTTSGGLSAISTGPGVNLPEGGTIAPGAIMPPPVNQQIEQEFETFANLAGQDPCIKAIGVCVAFLWKDGPDVQFHFNESDSLYITRIGTAAAATWVATMLVAAEQPELAAVAAGAIAGLDLAGEKYVKKHNCIGIEIEPVIFRASAGYYRSKSECG